jgi:hypothetical protein
VQAGRVTETGEARPSASVPADRSRSAERMPTKAEAHGVTAIRAAPTARARSPGSRRYERAEARDHSALWARLAAW